MTHYNLAFEHDMTLLQILCFAKLRCHLQLWRCGVSPPTGGGNRFAPDSSSEAACHQHTNIIRHGQLTVSSLYTIKSEIKALITSGWSGLCVLPGRRGRSRPTDSTCGISSPAGPGSCPRRGAPRRNQSASRRHWGWCRWSGSSSTCSARPGHIHNYIYKVIQG